MAALAKDVIDSLWETELNNIKNLIDTELHIARFCQIDEHGYLVIRIEADLSNNWLRDELLKLYRQAGWHEMVFEHIPSDDRIVTKIKLRRM